MDSSALFPFIIKQWGNLYHLDAVVGTDATAAVTRFMAIEFRKMFKRTSTPPSEPAATTVDAPVRREPDDAAKILVWGPPGCGKSAFVCGWFCDDAKKWKIREDDDITRAFREDGTTLLSNHDFLPPTNPNTLTRLQFTFEKIHFFTPERLRISVPECAGERFTAMDEELLNSIDEYDGILWLIDPVKAWNEQNSPPSSNPNEMTYRKLLHRWLHAFHVARGTRKRGARRMAFCLTKMDHPDHIVWRNYPAKHFRNLVGPDSVNLVRDYCDPSHVKYFACSVVGVDENNESNAMQRLAANGSQIAYAVGERLNCRPTPFGLFEPLEWLLGK
jgi:hypothetical protein